MSQVALLVLVGMGLSGSAHAYVDPGSGTLAWQVIFSGVIGCLFFFKRHFSNLGNRLRHRK